MSCPEGEDKPLKYPDMFRAADLMLLNKVDLLPHLAFDAAAAVDFAQRVRPGLRAIHVSATRGDGFDEWLAWLEQGMAAARAQREASVDALLAACGGARGAARCHGRARLRTGDAAGSPDADCHDTDRSRRIEARGLVQGVGFRPFVHRLAAELELAGWVRNDGAGVTIEVEGEAPRIDALARRLQEDAPRLARVDHVAVTERDPEGVSPGFAISGSAEGRVTTAIGPDSAICDECLAELFDPADRRHRYAFINCTHCGPRYTLTRGLPYDRRMTSMATFTQCPSCLLDQTGIHPHASPSPKTAGFQQ